MYFQTIHTTLTERESNITYVSGWQRQKVRVPFLFFQNCINEGSVKIKFPDQVKKDSIFSLSFNTVLSIFKSDNLFSVNFLGINIEMVLGLTPGLEQSTKGIQNVSML